MSKNRQSQSVTFRCPLDLLDKLQQSAEGQSPAQTLSREIVERLTESYDEREGPSTGDITAPFQRVIDDLRSRLAELEKRVGEGKK